MKQKPAQTEQTDWRIALAGVKKSGRKNLFRMIQAQVSQHINVANKAS